MRSAKYEIPLRNETKTRKYVRNKRNITLAITALLASVHGIYLYFLITRHAYSAAATAGILGLAAAEYVSHFRQIRIPEEFASAGFTVLSCMLGASLTFALSQGAQLGPIGAGAAVGTLAGLLPANKYKELDHIRTAIYCGAFVGMSSPAVLGNVLGAAAAGAVCGLAMTVAATSLHGYGGKLGTIAFTSVCVTAGGAYLFSL